MIFFISCFFVMMNTTWAMTLSCPEVASPGEVITIRVEEQELNGIKAKYNFADGFTYQEMSLNYPWKSYYDGVAGFSIGNVTNQDNLVMDINVKVGMDIAVNTDYILQLTDIDGSNANYEKVDLENVSCKVKVLSNVDTLDSLVVENVTLSPEFDKNVLEYEATTREEKIVIKATATDNEAIISGDLGEQNLEFGVNTFVVKVTSSRGTIKEYKLYISRIKSNDATLKNLIISEGELDFKSDKYLYLVEVDSGLENIEVEAVTNDYMATVKINKPDKLSFGENIIEVIVTAEDGTIITYIINVYRLSNDVTIKSLTIKNYDIGFKSNIYKYNLKIKGENSLDLRVVLNDEKSTYKIIGNENLSSGGTIKIEVTAEDGTKAVYEIIVYNLSSDATIKSLTIKNYDIKFKSDVYRYQLNINDENKLDIGVILNDEKAKYEIVGNNNLKNNSVIKINVTAEDGTVITYAITINKKEKIVSNSTVKLSNDATIKSLTIKDYEIDFKSDVYKYELKIKKESKLEIEVNLNNDKAKYIILGNSNLENGSIIRIEVTAEDGTKLLYAITVKQNIESSDVAKIKNLIIKNYDINFNSDIYDYELLINDEDKLEIEVVLNDDKAKYEILGNDNLKDGSVIEIEVTSDVGDTNTYKINIKKSINDKIDSTTINYFGFIPFIAFIIIFVIVLVVKILKNKSNK